MAVAPHSLASQSAIAVLRDGGNAVEAMISAAATIAVAYPHMNSIGGDGFWIISKPGGEPVGIDACGRAAQAASIEYYQEQQLSSIPHRGPLAANTMAGTISGWNAAYQWSRKMLQGKLPISRLLEDSIFYAEQGVPTTNSQSQCVATKKEELLGIPGFAETFLTGNTESAPSLSGDRFVQSRLGTTLDYLAHSGLDDFYRGDLARSMAADLTALGSPLALADFERHQAILVRPLALRHSVGTVYNMPPPTQGLVSLLIVGMLDRILDYSMDPLEAQYVHACVEATKLAFAMRDMHVTDPDYMDVDPQTLLEPRSLDACAANINMTQASPWGKGRGPADTVWLGVIDSGGVAVSFIQSIYHEFGSGIVLPASGVNWQNRGCSFSLDPNSRNPLMPGRRPFHTLNPALARFSDGRTLVYGNMGGDGQPQSQSAVFTRIAKYGWNPQTAIDAPRWLLGRTWGQASDSLKLESRFSPETIAALREMGHEVEIMQAYDEAMGHAGAVVRHPNGSFEGGSDPRSDGAAIGW